MNNNNKFILQVFEKIGVPLFAAVNDVSYRAVLSGQTDKALSNTEHAEIVAKLLTNVTKTGSLISSKLELENKDPESDDLQISLAAILSPVVSNMYQLTGVALNDEDIEKISSSFETLATFSSHFSSLSEGNERLDNISASDDASGDNLQRKLQSVMGMVPIINSISAFSFGEDQNRLIKKVSQRIEKEVKIIQSNLPDEIKNNQNSTQQLISSITLMYSQCHFSEMARIMALSDKERETANITIDNVWNIFDQKISMLETLVISITEDSEDTNASNSPKVTDNITSTNTGNDSNEKLENKSNIKDQTDTPVSGSPMSFFAGNKSNEDEAG